MKVARWTGAVGIVLGLASPTLAQDDMKPLSAIDWLSESIARPAEVTPAPADPATPPSNATRATRTPPADETPVSEEVSTPDVDVLPLDASSPDSIGLLPTGVTGLPTSLWVGSDEDVLITLLRDDPTESLPALRRRLTTLLLAEADPPHDGGPKGDLFIARIDRLLDMGALEPAEAMLEQTNPVEPELFRRWFDVSLLLGDETDACKVMMSRPEIAPAPPARIFCLARSGDWNAAALMLNTAETMGDIDEETSLLLAHFLDPDLFEGEPPLPTPTRPSPLVFRMREAIGQSLMTNNLPLAFAQADLRSTSGWKAQLEAAERLARTGAIQPAVLFGRYTDRVPAASGGVWERAKAVQRLEAALESGDDVDSALESAWAVMADVDLLPVLADAFVDTLKEAQISTDAAKDLRFRLLLLSDQYESAALSDPMARENPVLRAIARGDVADLDDVPRTEEPIVAAFRDAPADANAEILTITRQNSLGEAILRTLAIFDAAIAGDMSAMTEGLATLRALGLEDTARRAALEYLILRDA